MANILDKTAQIRQAVYGKDVRESIASGIESINTEVESTTQRQTDLEEDWVDVKADAIQATSDANTARDFANAQGNFAKAEGEALVNTINQFNYVGEYDPTVNYLVKNMVKYRGSTFVNKVACQGILPTNSTNWQEIATGYVIKGNYNSTKNYEIHDLVYYGIEKKFYECIQPAGLGISPYNTQYWKVVLDVKDMVSEINDYVNDTTSLYVAHMGVEITHNLNKCPRIFAYTISQAGFGMGAFGCGSYGGGGCYEILTRGEYPDLNTTKIYLNEAFDGTPTITPISGTEYQIDFSNDISIKIELY